MSKIQLLKVLKDVTGSWSKAREYANDPVVFELARRYLSCISDHPRCILTAYLNTSGKLEIPVDPRLIASPVLVYFDRPVE